MTSEEPAFFIQSIDTDCYTNYNKILSFPTTLRDFPAR